MTSHWIYFAKSIPSSDDFTVQFFTKSLGNMVNCFHPLNRLKSPIVYVINEDNLPLALWGNNNRLDLTIVTQTTSHPSPTGSWANRSSWYVHSRYKWLSVCSKHKVLLVECHRPLPIDEWAKTNWIKKPWSQKGSWYLVQTNKTDWKHDLPTNYAMRRLNGPSLNKE